MSAPLHPAFARGAVRVFAHRGGAQLAPENTLAAFDQALAHGVDGLELDVRLSRDGVAIVHHDATVERTTNGRGAVADLTADELGRLDAAAQFGSNDGYPYRGRGVGVPRLRDLLDRYPGVPMIVELKVDSTDLVTRLVGDIRAAQAEGHVALGSFQQGVLAAARAEAPEIPTGASTDEVRALLWRARFRTTLRRPPYRMLQVPKVRAGRRVVSRGLIRAAHRAGLAVQVWTVDHERDMHHLLAWGIDAIITDRPDVAVGIVKAWNAHGRNTE